MGINNWWALGFLVMIPLIIVLYLLKQKAKEYEVSSLFLWKETYKNITATTWWEKLHHNLLMYLQILAMLAIILALAAPYLKGSKGVGKNIVLVLDTSASMNAEYEKSSSRMEYAKKQAVEYVKSKKEGTVFTIITCDQSAKLVLNNCTNQKEVVDKIQNTEQTDLGGNLSMASDFIESYVAELKAYEVMLYTDSDCNLPVSGVTYVDVSNSGKNLCIDYVNHSLEENELQVLCKVSNSGNQEVTTDINLYLNERMQDIQSVTLKPEESKVVYFNKSKMTKEQQKEITIVKAEINEKDQLLKDNMAYDLITNQGNKKVLLVSEQNLFLEKAMQASQTIQLYKVNDVEHIDSSAVFDLYVYDGIMPKIWPKEGNVILVNPSQGITYDMMQTGIQPESNNAYNEKKDLFNIEKKAEQVLVETKKSNITEYMDGYTFGVASAVKMKKPVWAESFFQTGDYSEGFFGKVGNQMIAIIGFDLHSSELPLQTEFPIFIHNLMQQCLISDYIENKIIQTGDSIQWYVNDEEMKITLRQGEESKSWKAKEQTTYSETKKAGLYSFTFESEKGKEADYVVAKFPTSTESSMKQKGITVTRAGKEKAKQQEAMQNSGFSIFEWFAIGALFILAVEWLVYIRQM